jgi:hypothetical protein
VHVCCAALAGCLVLQPGQEYTMNFTFTQQPMNGFVAIWDPAAWENGTTPGSGVQLLAETNFPASPSGIFVLPTTVGACGVAHETCCYKHAAVFLPVLNFVREDSYVLLSFYMC